MSDENKRPRRLRGSAGPRPARRIAGQGSRPVRDQHAEGRSDDAGADDVAAHDVAASGAIAGGAGSLPAPPAAKPDADALADEPASGVLESRRTTVVLTSVLAVTVVLLLALTVTFFAGEPDEGEVKRWEPTVGAGKFELPKSGERPVTVGPVEWAGSVDEVAKAVTRIFTFSAKTIDTHVDDVAGLMTDDFRDGEYQETFAATSGKVKSNAAEYQMSVVGQSAITASSDRVTVLLFANQFVSKGTGKDVASELNPVRLIVSAIRVENAWKIDKIKAG